MKQTKNQKKKRRYRDPHETLTLKYWLIGALVVALIVGGTVLATSILSKNSLVEFTYSNGVLTRVSDGRVFMKADDSFEVLFPLATDADNTPYGECEDFKIYKVGYYNQYGNLKTMDIDNYLTDGIYFYFSYYVDVPSFDKFKADTVRVGELSEDGKSRLYLKTFEKDEAATFISDYKQRNFHDKTKAAGIKTYCVQLTSAEFSYLCYMLYAVECEDGSWYVYTEKDKTPISMSAHWFSSLKQKTEDTTASSGTVETPSES